MLELTVRQVQTNTGLFKMPMNIRVTTANGSEDHRVWLEAVAEQTVTIQLQADATAVELNPDTHVLCEIAHASEPDLELGPRFPRRLRLRDRARFADRDPRTPADQHRRR